MAALSVKQHRTKSPSQDRKLTRKPNKTQKKFQPFIKQEP